MLKKALTFLGFFLAITVTVYCLNTYAKINTEIANNHTVGYMLNAAASNANNTVANNNIPTINLEEPEKIMIGTIIFTATNNPVHICNTSDIALFTFDYSTSADYDETTTFSAVALDGTLNAAITPTFSPTSFGPGATLTATQLDMQISGLFGYAPGTYTINVTATSDGTATSVTVPVTLIIDELTIGQVTTIAPDGTNNEPLTSTAFSWNANSNATFYNIQIATDPSFTTVVHSANTTATSYVNPITLINDTVYYWRVKGRNSCVTGANSTTKNFKTLALVKTCYQYPGSGFNIPNGGSSTSIVNVGTSFTVSDVNLSVIITHPAVNDLIISLIPPLASGGSEITLYNGGCTSIDMNVTFDDAGAVINCTTITGTIIPPSASLSGFNGLSSLGDWTLKIADTNGLSDIGILTDWNLELCEGSPISFVPIILVNDGFQFSENVDGSQIVPLHLNATTAGGAAVEQVYTLTQLPSYDLLLNGTILTLGQTFTQEDINNNLVTYNNSSGVPTTDFFTVNITNANNDFLSNVVVNINIDNTLGVDDDFFIKTGISIFPTVSNGEFNISSSKYLGKATIELYTYTGMRVFTDELNFNGNTLESVNVSNLAQGIYILKIFSDTTVGSKKIIIR